VCLEKARHRAWFRCLPLILLFCARAPGQTPAVDGNGVTAEWDVRSYMTQLVADVQRMRSLLNRVDAPHWVSRGAPEAYIQQSKSSLDAMEHLVAATEDLSRQPEKLSAAIETFFQLERMELLVASLNNGVRKWQSEHTANEMSEALSANMVHRDRLRQHIRDLASARENEQRIMNEEAQRCRGMLTREAPAPPVRSAPRRSRRQVRP
jgi:hypothetical protein